LPKGKMKAIHNRGGNQYLQSLPHFDLG